MKNPFRKLWNRSASAEERVARVVPEASESEIQAMLEVGPFTMTGIERRWAMLSAIKYLDRQNIDGDVVECGVWKGGSMLLAKKACTKDRKFWLYDTYAGMDEPTSVDIATKTGTPAWHIYNKLKKPDHVDWCFATVDEVRGSFAKASLLDDKVKFIKGKTQDTLRDSQNVPEKIALLRLDTDWYESTSVELKILYPRLVSGGVLIIDDYGYWQGSKKAVDEYFQGNVLLHRIDFSARMAIKAVD